MFVVLARKCSIYLSREVICISTGRRVNTRDLLWFCRNSPEELEKDSIQEQIAGHDRQGWGDLTSRWKFEWNSWCTSFESRESLLNVFCKEMLMMLVNTRMTTWQENALELLRFYSKTAGDILTQSQTVYSSLRTRFSGFLHLILSLFIQQHKENQRRKSSLWRRDLFLVVSLITISNVLLDISTVCVSWNGVCGSWGAVHFDAVSKSDLKQIFCHLLFLWCLQNCDNRTLTAGVFPWISERWKEIWGPVWHVSCIKKVLSPSILHLDLYKENRIWHTFLSHFSWSLRFLVDDRCRVCSSLTHKTDPSSKGAL
jgi:hypothetical protein